MADPVRKTGQSVTVFSLTGTSYIDDLENATITLDGGEKDGVGIAEAWSYAFGTKNTCIVEADVFVSTTAAILLLFNTVKALILTTGGISYAGNFLISGTKHGVKRDDLQMYSVTLKNRGAVTVT